MALEEITSLLIESKHTCQAVLPDGYNPGSTDQARTVRVNGWDIKTTLVASQTPTPNPTAVLTQEITIDSGGSHSLDLTDAPIIGATSSGAPADGEDLTAKKAFRLVFDTRGGGASNNASGVTVKAHGTNGYPLFGSSGLVVLPPNSRVEFLTLGGGLPAISGTVKVIQLTGTENDVVRVFIVFETPAA